MSIAVFTPDEAKRAIKNKQMCSHIGNFLAKLYPNRGWFVTIGDDGSVAWIACTDISINFGICVHLAGEITFDIEQLIKRAAGEILERFNLARNAYAQDTDKLIIGVTGDEIHAKQGYI